MRANAPSIYPVEAFAEKPTDYYAPQFERCIAWSDPAIGIEWPLTEPPQLSAKDQAGLPLAAAEVFG